MLLNEGPVVPLLLSMVGVAAVSLWLKELFKV